MNRTTRLTAICLTFATLLFAGMAVAGHPDSDRGKHFGRHHSAENHIGRLTDSLGLSDEQSAEVLAVLQEAEASRRALHKELMEAARPEICAQREATHAEILAILTPDQAAQFEDMVAEHKSRSFGRGPRGGLTDMSCDDVG